MATSKIEWTESTWNPLTGCTKVSSGFQNCYAERMAIRLQAMKSPNYKNGFKLTIHENLLSLPSKWKKPRIIFVNSMSDLFHEDVPIDFIKKVFSVMVENKQHIFQVLTKRSQRLLDVADLLPWPSNIFMGVTVESIDYVDRINELRNIPASVRFISCEPLLSSLGNLDLTGIHWVIVGGESGPHARPMEKEWVTEIHRHCQDQHVPFFFKQWGGTNKKKNGCLLDGRIWHELPHGMSLLA